MYAPILYLYMCFHTFFISKMRMYIDEEDNFNLFEKNFLIYAFFMHMSAFVCWISIDQLVIHKRILKSSSKYESIQYTLPYIVVYHDLYDMIWRKHSFIYYKLSMSGLWLFTSPYIQHIFVDTFDHLKEVGNRHILTDFIMHLINLIYNLYGIYSPAFDNNKLLMFACMYFLYLFTLYYINKHDTVYKYYLLLCFISIGVNETLLLLHVIDEQTYVLFVMINDLYTKCIIFSFNIIKHVSLYENFESLTLYNAQKIHDIYKLVQSLDDNSLIKKSLYDKIHPILSTIEYTKTISTMDESIISKRFSKDVVNELIRKKTMDLSEVVIMFSDIVDYSKMASQESSTNVLYTLQSLYEAYDREIQNYSALQKIESIGDCYMVSSLLDNLYSNSYSNETKCEQMFSFSERVIEIANCQNLKTRVGLHIGDVSLGIIGKEVPRLGIVGHDVNLCARLENTCPINSIQLSTEFRKFVKQRDFCKKEVDLKNIGTYTTYVYHNSSNHLNYYDSS